jgi:hypothetical protein
MPHYTLAFVEFDGGHDYLHLLVNYPHRHSPIHRATASHALKDGFAVHAILPRPEGRGLSRDSGSNWRERHTLGQNGRHGSKSLIVVMNEIQE